jgi:hypothetical protein
MRNVRILLAGVLVASATGNALADRAPNQEERTAIEAALRAAGFTSWEEIEFDDDDDDEDDQVWEVDDATGADGQEYDLKLDQSYQIIKRERD